MVGLELVAGYLAAWVVGKVRREGQGLDGEVDHVLRAGLERLHEAVAGKLGGSPAVAHLEAEATQDGALSQRTRRRVRDAVEEAVEHDEAIAAALQVVLAELDHARVGAPSVAGIDLRSAQGVQVGDHNTMTSVFGR